MYFRLVKKVKIDFTPKTRFKAHSYSAQKRTRTVLDVTGIISEAGNLQKLKHFNFGEFHCFCFVTSNWLLIRVKYEPAFTRHKVENRSTNTITFK